MLITIAQVVAIQHDTASDGGQGDTSDQTNGHSTCSVCFLANHFEHRTSDVSGMELQKQKIATPKLWPVLGDCSLII
ncbi:hypothetical protein WP50_22560 [Lactiplantibacillus plantarum]|nr:hypothetical protein WP50_22560 [Lactiplantibacillus plantarum]